MKPIERARQEMTAAGASAEHADFMAHMGKVLDAAMKLKKAMTTRNLTVAKAKCPMCAGHLHGRLAGPKKHMRMWCDGTCNSSMME